jgi:hypothetical protein
LNLLQIVASSVKRRGQQESDLSKFRITPVGTCRVHNALRNAVGKYPVDHYVPRTYGFTHTSTEAIQQLDYLQGKMAIPADLLKAITRPGSDPSEWQGDWTQPDLVIVEISSSKAISADGYAMQTRYLHQAFADFFGNPQRARDFWALAERDPDSLAEFLQADASYRALPDSDQRLLRSLRMSQQGFDALAEDMAKIAQQVDAGRLLFVTHVNAVDGKGRRLPAREKLIRWVERIAEDLEVDCFNPTELMLEFGQERAMEQDGADTTHYTGPFLSRIYAHLHQHHVAPRLQGALGASAADSSAMQAQMLADTIQATLDHVDLVTGARQLHQALRNTPGSAALIELRGILRERLGDFEGAHADLTGLDEFPLSTASREALMRACLELGHDAEALALAEGLIDEEIDNSALRLGAATAADRLGARDKAQSHWKSLSRLDRKNVHAALRVLQGVAEEGPDAESEWRQELGYFAQHDSKLAEALARHAAAHADAALFAASVDALARNEPVAAGDLLLQFDNSPLVFAASRAVGRVLSSEGLPSRLIKAVREIGRGWGMQSIALAEQGRLEEAASLADASADALGDNMANKGQRAVAAAMLVRARELASEGRSPAVLDLCHAHDGIVMSRPRLALEVARALQSTGREDEAAELARRAAERFPDDLPVTVLAARLWQRRDLAAAALLYRRAGAIDADGRFAEEIAAFWPEFALRAPERVDAHVDAGEFEPALSLAAIMAEAGNDDAGRQRARICDAIRDRIAALGSDEERQERRRLVDLLLREQPDDPFALGEAATAATESGDFAQALILWQRLAAADAGNDSARNGIVRCRLLLSDTEGGQERAVSAA